MISHLISNIISLFISQLAWKSRKNVADPRTFKFDKITKLVSCFAILVFPWIITEPDFQSRVALVCIIVMEIVGLFATLYVMTVRIVLHETTLEVCKFFVSRQIPYCRIESIAENHLLEYVIVKLNNQERFTFSSEIPGSKELIDFLKNKDFLLNGEEKRKSISES